VVYKILNEKGINMAKYVSQKLLPIFLGIGVLAPAYYIYDAYTKSLTPSVFESSANRLGFNGYKKTDQTINAAQHQEALLKQFQMAGYFQPENLWHTINHLGVKDPITTFTKMYSAVKRSKADQSDPSKFNAKILRKNLGKGTKLDEQDAMDFLLYTAQNAFGRKPGQERNELSYQDWMNKYKQDYFEAAKILRLIDREIPAHKEYDEAWIAGASRIGVLTRIIDYHYILSKYGIKIKGKTEILGGERGLWANIDGITPIVRDKIMEAYKTKSDLDTIDISLPVGEDKERVEEGKEYITSLAARYGIKLNPTSPFIQYTTKEDCPPGHFPARLYPNYAEGESRKLTETLMSQDLIATYLPSLNTITTVDTLAEQHQRPTTSSTARDAATKFVKRIADGEFGDQREFVILYETNNPYIERQEIATQREVNKVLKAYKLDRSYIIKIEGVGFKCKQDVTTVHSELAALIAEKWKTATGEDVSPKRPIEKLLFQTRDNSSLTTPWPDISEVDTGRVFQDFFDEYLS